MPVPRLPKLSGITPKLDAWFAAVTEAAERMLGLTATPPLQLKWTPAGPVVSLASAKRRTFRLATEVSGGEYTGTEVYEAAGGGWDDLSGGYSGVTLREFNATEGLPADSSAGLVVEAGYYPEADEWRFQMGVCS